MTKKEIEIASLISELDLLARKSKVIANDLEQDYFDVHIESTSDNWKITGSYYEAAGLKLRIVNDYLFKVTDKFMELRELFNSEEYEERAGK